MTKSPVSAFLGPIPAAFRRRSTFVAAPSCRRAGTDTAQAPRTLMDERQKHPAPTAEPRWAAHRRSSAGASIALSVREKLRRPTTAIRIEGISSARSTHVIVVDDEPVSREATFSAIHTPSRKGGRTGGPSGSGGRSRSGSREGRRGFSAPAISENLLSRANNGPQEEPIASSFPSVMRGLKPNPFGQQRLRSTNFPFGQSRIPREANSPPFAVLRMRSGPSGAGRPGRAFLCRTEGNALAMGQRPPALRKRFSKMASNRSKSSPKRETRQALTFEMALQLCPHEGVAENVATAFGLIVPDYDAIRGEYASALKRMGRGLRRLPQRKGDRDALPAHRRGPRRLRSRGGTLLLHQGRRGPRRDRPGRRRRRRRTRSPSASKARRSGPANSPPTWRCRPTPCSPPPTARSTPTRT